MNSLSPKPRFSVLPAMMFAIGLGLVFYYGDLWRGLPAYSPAEVEQSAELNLMLDLHRQGPAKIVGLDQAEIQALRQKMLDEVQAEILRERRDIQRGVGTGVVLLVLGLVQMWLIRRAASRNLVAANRRRS